MIEEIKITGGSNGLLSFYCLTCQSDKHIQMIPEKCIGCLFFDCVNCNPNHEGGKQ